MYLGVGFTTLITVDIFGGDGLRSCILADTATNASSLSEVEQEDLFLVRLLNLSGIDSKEKWDPSNPDALG
jgi:hypothetical protein